MSKNAELDITNRRTILRTLAVGAGISTAGCMGGGGSGSTPDYEVDRQAPARLELLAVSFPDEITFGETFSGEVSLANTGGDPITSDARIGIRPIASDTTNQVIDLNSSGLESGQSRTHSTTDLAATQAGEFIIETGRRIDSVNDELENSFNINPIESELEEQVETPDGIRLTVNDVTYEQALLNESRSGGFGQSDMFYSVRNTLEGQILAVPRLTIGNATGETIRLLNKESSGRNTLSILGGSPVTDIDTVSIDQPDIRGSRIEPGETLNGIIISEVSTDDLGDISLGLNTGSPEGEIDIAVPLPESDGIPEFQLVDSTTPSVRQEGEQEYRFTIENTGNADGTFRGAVRYQFTEDSEHRVGAWVGTWSDWDRYFVQDIAAGESETVSFTSNSDYSVKYELMPLGETFTTTAQ